MSILNLQVVEWSRTQRCFHRHTLAEMLRHNIAAFGRQAACDYIPIGIFETDAEASDFLARAYRFLDRSS